MTRIVDTTAASGNIFRRVHSGSALVRSVHGGTCAQVASAVYYARIHIQVVAFTQGALVLFHGLGLASVVEQRGQHMHEPTRGGRGHAEIYKRSHS